MSLSAREFARALDVREILVVCDNRNGVWGALEVLFPFRKGKNDGKEFSVINVIVMFHWGEHLGEVGAGVEIAICVFLHKNGTSSKKRSIRHDVERARNIRDGENRGCSEDAFESIKGILMKWCSNPRNVLTS